MKIIKLGSKDCNWFIPDDFLTKDSIVYSFGAGEDIQFEVDLVNKYDCIVNIFDPTPRACDHFENRSKYYKISHDDDFRYSSIALSDINGKAKFYMPENPLYVSCSLEKQNTNFVYCQTDTLENIMIPRYDDHIDLLKMDIEGSEYKVLKQIIEQKIPITCICVEFHNGPMELSGYDIIKIDGHNYSFFKKQI